jgi:autotransporter-associated beta strand protein
MASLANAQVLPSGALIDINNGTGGNSASNTANVFQNYSTTFTTSTTGNNYVLFAFREDPQYWTFGNVSLTVTGQSTNLLRDPNFIQGGAVGTSGIQAPANWGVVYQTGSAPQAAGSWYAPGQAPNPATSSSGLGVNLGVSGSWYDGAVGSFDGIYQGISLVSGTSYTLSFTTLANDSASVANGVELGAFSGVCSVTTGPASNCTPGASSGFTSLATPAQAANAGGPAVTNIDTNVPFYLASNLGGSVNPVFQGGVLQTDQAGGAYNLDFTLDGSGTNTIDQTGNSSTFSGVFSDATVGAPGSIIIANSGSGGSVTFSGVNTYTGSTTVNAGAELDLSGAGSIASSAGVIDTGVFNIAATTYGASIVTLSGSGFVVLGGQTLTLTNAANTFSGVISGQGGLAITGGGEVLTGVNTFSGGVSVTNASLAINSDAALGASSGRLSLNNGTLFTLASLSAVRAVTLTGADTLNTGGHSVTLSGPVGGSGRLTATGGGLLTLTGSNTYSGGTTITGGSTLAVGSDAALGAPGGSLTFSNGALLALASFTSSRAIVVNQGGGAINANGYTVNLNGPITLNGALSSTGSGAVYFTSQAQVNGSLTVSGGIFSNNGQVSAQSVVVTSTGILRGTGVVNAPTVIAGKLAPGNSPGTLTFTAPVMLLAGSTSEFDIDGAGTGTGGGNYSRVIVTGAANVFTAAGALEPLLRGITGSATNTFTPAIGSAFQVVSADGGIAITSSYTSLIQPTGLAAGTRFDAVYAPTTLTLIVTPQAYGNLPAAGIGETTNQRAIGAALDAIRPAAGVRLSASDAALFYPLYAMTGPQISAALNRMSPVAYGDSVMGARQAWYLGASSVSDQLADRRSGAASANAKSSGDGVTLWGNGLGQFNHVGAPGGESYGSTVGGVIAGVDKALSAQSLLGAAIGGGKVQTSVASGGSASGDLIQASIYGAVRAGRFFLDGQADYEHVYEDVTRTFGAQGSPARGETTLQGGGVQVEGGLHLQARQWRIEPTLGLSIMDVASSAAHESTGGVLGENVGQLSSTSVQSFAGLRLGTELKVGPDAPVQIHGLLGWSHEMKDAATRTSATLTSFGADTGFTVETPMPGRDAVRAGTSFVARATKDIDVYGAYTAEVSRDATSQDLTLGVRVRW